MNKNKIKILIINPSSDLGGGNTISNNLAINLDKNIFEIFSFFPKEGPSSIILKNVKNVKILIPFKLNLISTYFFLYRFIKINKIDIIHTQGTRANFWIKFLFLFLKSKPKLIYTLHGLHIAYRFFWQKYLLLWLEKISNILVDKLVSPSLSVNFLVKKYKIIKKSKTELIYHGIDIQKFNKAFLLDKKILKIPDNYLIISAIQRLNFPKDISTILKSFKIIKEKFKNVILLIVGSGPLEKELILEVKELKIIDNVLFLGDRQDVPNILAISDIVILSTAFEALGLSLVEAMANKKSIIGSDVDGVKEVIENGVNGFLFKFGDEKDLTKKIKILLENENLRKKMGEMGFETVKEKFSLEKMIKEYENLYLKLLK